jgi:hypothetical protein
MRFIPTKIHGLLDYLSAALFVASPWLFDFADGTLAQWVPIGVGLAVLAYSLVTDYELGPVKRLSMPAHLRLDLWLSGVFLAASPWLFGFVDRVYLPHVCFGLFSIVAGLVTRKTPYAARVG